MSDQEINDLAHFIKAAMHDGPLKNRADIACALVDRGVTAYREFLSQQKDLTTRLAAVLEVSQSIIQPREDSRE